MYHTSARKKNLQGIFKLWNEKVGGKNLGIISGILQARKMRMRDCCDVSLQDLEEVNARGWLFFTKYFSSLFPYFHCLRFSTFS